MASSLSQETSALVAALSVSGDIVELREAVLKARAAAKVAIVEERLRPPAFTELEQSASRVQTSELRRVLTWAAERRKFKMFSKRGGGGAGGRGAEEVPDDDDDDEDEEAAAAAAAEAAGEDLGIVDRVKCTHEYCGVCGAPWLEDDDVEATATGFC